MRVLIVFCHPANGSFVATLFRALVASLEARGHLVRTLDLYYDGFDPVLDLESWHAHRRGKRHEAGLSDHVTALRDCEALVFVYPTWWYGQPAMLKGWFDRVWQPDVAFTLKNGEFQTHTLTNIRRLAVITTCGSPGWFIEKVVGDPARRQFIRGLAQQLAPAVRTNWQAIYDVDRRNEADLAEAGERAVDKVARFIGRR